MQKQYQSILDHHPEQICRFDPDFIINYSNKAFADFYGRAASDLLGSNLVDIVQIKEISRLEEKLSHLTVDNPRVTLVSSRAEPSGRDIILSWIIIGLFDENGDAVEYQAFGRDITDEVELRASLEQRNEDLNVLQTEMRLMLDSMPCKVWYKDDKNTILKLNKTAAISMGMDVKSVEGANTYDLFGDGAKAYHEADLQVINSGVPLLGFEERYTPNDGENGWVQTDKIPFDHPVTGEKRILVVASDITELKEKEALLTSINKNLDDFASLTSHDLQAPLRHIGIFAELLQDEFAADIGDEGKDYIAEILNSVEHMRGLIKSFLKFMRASPEGIEMERVNLSDAILKIAKAREESFADLGTSITLPEDEIIVRGDKILLEQVLTNLLDNAIKYRNLAAPVIVNISAKKSHGEWTISVADNGVGIDPNYAPYVFDLFGRAKPHSHREGSGVGLALCKRIITLHGGTITLSKDRAIGSEFKFTLKAA